MCFQCQAWGYSGDKDIILVLIDYSLRAKSGIKNQKKKRYKSLSVVKGKVRLLQELKTGRSDLILAIRKVSQKKSCSSWSPRYTKSVFFWVHCRV